MHERRQSKAVKKPEQMFAYLNAEPGPLASPNLQRSRDRCRFGSRLPDSGCITRCQEEIVRNCSGVSVWQTPLRIGSKAC